MWSLGGHTVLPLGNWGCTHSQTDEIPSHITHNKTCFYPSKAGHTVSSLLNHMCSHIHRFNVYSINQDLFHSWVDKVFVNLYVSLEDRCWEYFADIPQGERHPSVKPEVRPNRDIWLPFYTINSHVITKRMRDDGKRCFVRLELTQYKKSPRLFSPEGRWSPWVNAQGQSQGVGDGEGWERSQPWLFIVIELTGST